MADRKDSCKVDQKYEDEISEEECLLFSIDRIIILYTLRMNMIKQLYVAHSEIEATLKLAHDNIFWLGMSSEITNAIQGCET